MNKIKELFSNISKGAENIVKKFPLTIILVVLVTVFSAICMQQSWMSGTLFHKILLFGVISTIGVFFSETYFSKKIVKIMMYMLSGAIAYGFVQLVYITDIVNESIVKSMSTRMLFGYIFILVIFTIYKLLKDSQLKIEEYLLKVFANVFQLSIIYGVLNIGISLIVVIFTELLLDGVYGEIFARILTLLFGLFYIPSLIYSVSETSNKEISHFIKGLVKYVLFPLSAIAMGIIYMYILKILITRKYSIK